MGAASMFKSEYFQIRLYGVLSVLLVLIVGYFTFNNVMNYLDLSENGETNKTILHSITETDKRITEEYQTVQLTNKEIFQTIQSELDLVFPPNQNHTNLTRTLEKFANDIHRLKDPFLISSLQYESARTAKDAVYSTIPFGLTINSSKTNFFKFLEFVDNSGTLKDKSRLIDIESISINFIKPKGEQDNQSGKDEINFNVAMNSYIRKIEEPPKK